MPTMMPTMTAPPTAPPTMAPMGTFLDGGDEFDVGEDGERANDGCGADASVASDKSEFYEVLASLSCKNTAIEGETDSGLLSIALD